MALPAALTRLAASETHMVTRVCPMERYTAAPALYRAFAGKDRATIRIYVLQASMVAGSVEGYMACSSAEPNRSISAIQARDRSPARWKTWEAARSAFSFSLLPIYWATTTAPPAETAVNR